ncbi:hypothetical protein HZF24_08100 [Sedimentibacter hydroxybenzoicus DSM 7310]|uniref:Uncharacterized protein n=1 Tax=Sedimentibacter hydroxybenzoicus DSM 7310 TaxID=1123245 RepID=A0A974BJ28_SEDHY|nr:hypothetical protein [Sedimentibacter hydroxybenzoicus]NYB74103.1 hypothetical protein [Sedimentibacter hydroxybenzoicus DSM 7310]
MEIIFVLISIFVIFMVVKGAVHQGTFDALKDFEEYMDKKEKNKID